MVIHDHVVSAAKVLTVTEFKARCREVIEGVAASGEPVILTRRSKAVARLVPLLEPVEEASPQDSLRGCLDIVGDIVAPVFVDWGKEPGAKRGRKRMRR